MCGAHLDVISLTRSKQWCMASYEALADLAEDEDTGVFMRRVNFYFRQPIEDSPQHMGKMNELKDKVWEFVHDRALIAANNVNPKFGFRNAYRIWLMVDTDVYMNWLFGRSAAGWLSRHSAKDLRHSEGTAEIAEEAVRR